MTTTKRVGYIALGESIERTGLSLVGLEMECLHLAPFEADEEFKEALARLSETIGFSCMTILGLLLLQAC